MLEIFFLILKIEFMILVYFFVWLFFLKYIIYVYENGGIGFM